MKIANRSKYNNFCLLLIIFTMGFHYLTSFRFIFLINEHTPFLFALKVHRSSYIVIMFHWCFKLRLKSVSVNRFTIGQLYLTSMPAVYYGYSASEKFIFLMWKNILFLKDRERIVKLCTFV